MTHQDRAPRRGQRSSANPERQMPPPRTSPRQALWSCLVAVVVIFILGVVFYGINSTETSKTASTPTPATTQSASKGGQSSSQPPQTTGQGQKENAAKEPQGGQQQKSTSPPAGGRQNDLKPAEKAPQ